MKRRVMWFLAGLLLLLACGLVLSWPLLFPPSLPRELAIRVPPDPLIFIQCSQLWSRVEQLIQRAEYANLLHSEFLINLNTTEWWPGFCENFLAFWRSLIIDPMHIIGHEMAIAVYASEVGEVLPRAILIGKTDQVARIAERLMYGYDRLTHQIGITFYREYQQNGIYLLQTPDMIWPLYYAVVGEAGLISTSLPLLYETIPFTMVQKEQPQAYVHHRAKSPTVFTTVFPTTLGREQIVTGYIDLERFAEECQRNPVFRMLGMDQWQTAHQQAIHVSFAVETGLEQLLTRIQWFTADTVSEDVSVELPEKTSDWQSILDTPLPQPLVMTGNISEIQTFMRVGQQLFSSWSFRLPFGGQGIYGERLECSLSERLTGLIYTLPEIECLIDTRHLQESEVFLNDLVQVMLVNSLTPLLQNQVITKTETYRDTEISTVELKLPLVKQEIVHYAVASADSNASAGYTIVSNSNSALKQQIDKAIAHPESLPYQLKNPVPQAGFLAVVNPRRSARFLEKFSHTPTFAFLVPPQQLQLVKQTLPFVSQGVQLLPTVTIAGGTVRGQLVLEVRIHPEASAASAP